MKLTGISNFGPIAPFDTIEIPNFTVIIGPNGVGKSQLLQAINNQSVVVGDHPSLKQNNPAFAHGPTPSIVLITNSDALPSLIYSDPTNQTIRSRITSEYVGQIKINCTHDIISELAENLGITTKNILELSDDPWALGPEGLTKRLEFTPNSAEADRIATAFEAANQSLLNPPSHLHARGSNPIAELAGVSRKTGINPTLITEIEMNDNSTIGSFGIFSPNIDKVISYYRDSQSNNLLSKLNNTKYLDIEDFEKRYGRPPWLLIDEILHGFGLPYTVVKPVHGSPPPTYNLSLKRDTVSNPIQPNTISSGEKVLLRFALSMIPYDRLRVSLTQPNLLLLDEVDASLHPQMLYHWMETLQEEFVTKRNVSCILTTHSPITVALAREGTIFEMVEGDPSPKPITKQQALNRLTIGLPTLSVDHSGQRQVFVESDTDAAIFNKINTMLKKDIGLQRSLSFISTGMRNKDGVEQNAGYTVVESVTNALRESGNQTVFGLVDWDGHRSGNDVIKVISQDTHYTLENILLDPLLIGALLLRDSNMIFPQGINFVALSLKDSQIQQSIIDFIQSRISFPDGSPTGLQKVDYLGAPSANVLKAFTLTPGHEIEFLLIKAFPYLNRFSNNRGVMVKAIVDRVFTQYPELCPLPVASAFREISNVQS